MRGRGELIGWIEHTVFHDALDVGCMPDVVQRVRIENDKICEISVVDLADVGTGFAAEKWRQQERFFRSSLKTRKQIGPQRKTEKFVSARRRNQHPARVRSPNKLCSSAKFVDAYSFDSGTAFSAALKPIFECVPSQNGFSVDAPQRHSAILFSTGNLFPSASINSTSPFTM